MKKQVLLSMMTALFLAVFSGYIWADDTQPITAYAHVAPLNPKFIIKIFQSSGSDYDWDHPIPPSSGMDFGTLVNADPNDPTSALMADHHFLVLVSVLTNTGEKYKVQYTGASLAKNGDSTITLSGDAWTVSAGPHYGPNTKHSEGIDTTRHSAEDTYVVYTSNEDGDSDIFRLYFGITGDPNQAVGNKKLIPPTQPAGNYQGTVKLDVYALK